MKTVYAALFAVSLFYAATAQASAAGDYRTSLNLITGDWNNALSWQKFNGVIWFLDASYPGQYSGTGNVEIRAGATVSMNTTPDYPVASLTVNGGSISFYGVAHTLSVTGDVSLSNAASMINVANFTGINIHTLNIGGNLSIASSATYDLLSGDDACNTIFNGSAAATITVSGAGSLVRFYDCTINKTAASTTVTSASNPFIVLHNLSVTSGNLSLEATANAMYRVDNDCTVSTGSTLTHKISYAGNNMLLQVGGNLSIAGTYAYSSYSPVISMNATGTHYINTGSSSVNKLFLANGDFYANGTVSINADFYAMWNVATGSFHTNGQAVTASLGLVNSGGTVYIDGGSLSIGNTSGLQIGRTASSNGAVIMSSGTLTTPGVYIGSINATPATTASFAQSGGTINTSLIEVNISSSFTHSGGSNDVAGNLKLGFASSSYTNTMTANVQNINGDFYNVGTYVTGNNATMNVTGNWINNNVFTASPNSKVIFNGTGNQQISGTASTTFGSLVINCAAGYSVKAVSNNILVNGDLTVQSGSFDLGSYSCNRSSGGGTLTLAANTNLLLGGTTGGTCSGSNFPSNFSIYNFDPISTTIYNGSAQSICNAAVYGNLTLSNTGLKTAVTGNTMITGDLVNTGGSSFNANNGTIIFSGTGNQQLAGLTYSNIVFRNGGIKSLSAAAAVQKQLSIEAATTLSLGNVDCSLLSTAAQTANVAILPSTAVITYGTGRFIVERYIGTGQVSSVSNRRWQFVSSPVIAEKTIRETWQESGAATAGYGTIITGPGGANGLDANSAGPSMKYYNPGTGTAPDSWTAVTNTSGTAVSNAQGYMLFVRGDRTIAPSSVASSATVLRTRGKIYDPVAGHEVPAVTVAAGRFQSVGNPYPSAINFTNLTRSNLASSFVAWDPYLGTAGGYVTLSATNAWAAIPATSTHYASTNGTGANDNRIIQSGQAFFVRSNAASAGSISFTEAAKDVTSRLTNRENDSSDNNNYLRVNLYSNGSLIDGTATVYGNSFSNAIDEDDGYKMMNAAENFSLLRNNNNLVIEGRAPLMMADTIYFNMQNMKLQAYTIGFAPQQMPYGLFTAKLIDRYAGTATSVSLSDSSFISITINDDPASQATDRFKLVVVPAAAPLPVTITSVAASRNADRTIAVNWTVENELNIQQYVVERSADGISFTGIINTAATNSRAYTKNDLSPLAADNFYRIKAMSLDGQVQYSAVVKVAPLSPTKSISVYPNPVINKTVQVQFINQSKGIYQLQLSNKLGQVMYKGSVQVNSGASVQTIHLEANTAPGIYQLVVTNTEGKTNTIQVVIE